MRGNVSAIPTYDAVRNQYEDSLDHEADATIPLGKHTVASVSCLSFFVSGAESGTPRNPMALYAYQLHSSSSGPEEK
jgi:hypothetical protein